MSSPEAHAQEQPLSAEQQRVWRSLVEKAALRSLRMLEAFYLSEQEQEARKDAPLTSARYQQWLAWMEKMDADPKALFRQHIFVDEGALVENIKVLTQAMETLAELRANGKISVATQEHLGLPKIFQHVSPERLNIFFLTIGGRTPQQLEAELHAQGFRIAGDASFMMKSQDFTTEKLQEELQLIRLTVDDLFCDSQWHTTDQIFSKAKELGLELCPAEVGPCLRLKMTDQMMSEWLFIGMKPITGLDGIPRIFGVERDGDDSWLGNCWARPDYGWRPGYEFVFRLPVIGGANSHE